MPHKFPRVFCGSMWQLGDAFFTKFRSCSTQAKAAVAAHMAVHCRGARRVQLLEKSATIITISDNQEEEWWPMQQHPETSMCFLCPEHDCREWQDLCVYEGFTWALKFLFCRCFSSWHCFLGLHAEAEESQTH